MNVSFHTSLFAAFSLALTMCSSGPTAPRLEAGMTRQEVEKLWGEPQEKGPRKQGGELWYYNFPTTHAVTETYRTTTVPENTPGGPAIMGIKEQTYTYGVGRSTQTTNALKPIGFNTSGRLVDLQHGKPALR